ncbi:MAG: hypothetical protein AAF268_08865 [Cyanobacteria bacterium P01_A01_bin.3]
MTISNVRSRSLPVPITSNLLNYQLALANWAGYLSRRPTQP